MWSALSYPQYRRYWAANCTAVTGNQMMWIAQGWLVYKLTDSAVYLGYAGLATALPAIILNLLGGVIADRVDQRKVIFVTQAVSSAAVLLLGVLTASDVVRVWHVLVVAFVLGATQAFSNPARQSIFPQLIDKKDLMAAVSLNSMVWQGTRMIAPMLAGLTLGAFGSAVTFFICACLFMALGLVMLTLTVETPSREQRTRMTQDLIEGLSFIRHSFLFAFLIGMSFFSSLFGNGTIQLLPVFSEDILKVGPEGLGLMTSVMGVGAVLGIVAAGYLGDYERKGLLLVGGATGYGLFLIFFGYSTLFPLSLALLFCTGFTLQLYTVVLQSTLQMRVPDELRGRVMGIYGITHNIGPLGALEAGLIADHFGAPAAYTTAGAAIILFSLGIATGRAEIRSLNAPQRERAAVTG